MSRTRRLAVVLALNLGLVAALVVVGLGAHSLAVFAAGADYLADAAAVGVSLLAIWLASRPRGYPNATTVAALVNAGWLLILNIVIAVTAVWRLAAGAHRVEGLPVLVVSTIAAVVMLAGALVLGGDADDDADADDGGEDLNVKAVFLDTAADAAAAAGVAVSGAVILAAGGWYWLDPAVALVIAVIVGYHAAKLIRKIALAFASPPRQGRAMAAGQPVPGAAGRQQALLRRGRILEGITLGWNVAGIAVLAVAAVAARSVALAGFGLDSLIEIGASVVVLWELSGAGDERQRRALRLIGGAFLALAAYLTAQSLLVLVTGYQAGHSVPGIAWTAVTAAAMFALAAGKARTGKALGNPVLTTEGRVTLVDGILAVAVLTGLALNAAAGWWWADPAAALVIVFYALREARDIFLSGDLPFRSPLRRHKTGTNR